MRLLGLKVRTSAFQAGNVGFKSHRSHCDYRTMISSADCGSAHPGSIPGSHPMDGYA